MTHPLLQEASNRLTEADGKIGPMHGTIERLTAEKEAAEKRAEEAGAEQQRLEDLYAKERDDAERFLDEIMFAVFPYEKGGVGFESVLALAKELRASIDRAEDCMRDTWKAIDPEYDGGTELYDLPERCKARIAELEDASRSLQNGYVLAISKQAELEQKLAALAGAVVRWHNAIIDNEGDIDDLAETMILMALAQQDQPAGGEHEAV